MDSYASSCCSIFDGGFEPCSPTLSSSSGSNDVSTNDADDAVKYCQCIDSEDVALLECQDCGSFFEPGTYCPLFLDLLQY